MKTTILVVDDEPEAVELVEFNLRQAGYSVATAADGEEALKKAKATLPALIVLDLMLPEIDGMEVCKLLRRDASTAGIPIIMLTAKAAEIDRVLGLELGADDYLTKPFDPLELVLRSRNLLERSGESSEKADNVKRFEGWALDIGARTMLASDGKPLPLTRSEFNLLAALAAAPKRVLSRSHLLDAIARSNDSPSDRTVDVTISRLRRKIETDPKDPRIIVTVPGVGYMFAVDVT